jgi:hypothetical protein
MGSPNFLGEYNDLFAPRSMFFLLPYNRSAFLYIKHGIETHF